MERPVSIAKQHAHVPGAAIGSHDIQFPVAIHVTKGHANWIHRGQRARAGWAIQWSSKGAVPFASTAIAEQYLYIARRVIHSD